MYTGWLVGWLLVKGLKGIVYARDLALRRGGLYKGLRSFGENYGKLRMAKTINALRIELSHLPPLISHLYTTHLPALRPEPVHYLWSYSVH